MKTIYILFLIFLFASCNKGIDDKKILELYKDILIVRLQEDDTSIANPKVRDLFTTYNYPEETFKKDFYFLASKDEKFANKIDSLRRFILDGNR